MLVWGVVNSFEKYLWSPRFKIVEKREKQKQKTNFIPAEKEQIVGAKGVKAVRLVQDSIL